MRYTTKILYRRDEAVVSGGFLGGSRKAIARFYSAFHWKVIEMLFKRKMVDDDQVFFWLFFQTQLILDYIGPCD